MSLLEKAMSVQRRRGLRRYDDKERAERAQLAVAFANGVVSTHQSAEALGIQSRAVEGILRAALMNGVRAGIITVAMENGAERNGKK